MNKIPNKITVFEHQSLWEHKGKQKLSNPQLKALQVFFGEKGTPYYKLIHNGIQFKKYVGVIQVGNLLIEILPKADRYNTETDWRDILIGMLRAVNAFNVHAPSSSSLKIKSNFILDLYFELFVKELEYLFNKGLIKKYRKTEGNILALKGSILFSKHIQQNLVHQERFYVRHTQYDNEHLIHRILYKTLALLQRINTNVALSSRIGNLSLNFPDMNDLKVVEATFSKVVLNRKTEEYKNAIEISRLLLLNYHPDLSNGQNHVLALMFDMNLLWERFIYVSLRKRLAAKMNITAQTSKYFWKRENGSNSSIRPDIVITKDTKGKKETKDERDVFVIDTKWKNIEDSNPSPEDLRQLYVYHEYYKAQKVALVYPGKDRIISGKYYPIEREGDFKKKCSIIRISTDTSISDWQDKIADQIYGKWLDLEGFKKRN